MDEENVTSGGAIYYDEEYQTQVLEILQSIEENTSTSVTSSSVVDSDYIVALNNHTELFTFMSFGISLILGLFIFLLFIKGLRR